METRLADIVEGDLTSELAELRDRSSVIAQICHRGRAALEMLIEAQIYAEDLQRSPWDFALEIEVLRSRGLVNSDLRWLVCRGLLEQAIEIRPGHGDGRSFQQGGALTFTESSCFVLTRQGLETARRWLNRHPASNANGNGSHHDGPPYAAVPGVLAAPGSSNGLHAAGDERNAVKPLWDRDRQELRLGHRVVKQFKVPAPNQEMILAAFHEEGWPVRIDDPLPPRADLEPKRRLHDTINSLNRNQKAPLIRFLGDGTGQGVRWELAEAALQDPLRAS